MIRGKGETLPRIRGWCCVLHTAVRILYSVGFAKPDLVCSMFGLRKEPKE